LEDFVDVEGGELSKMVCESTEAAETLLLRSGWASRAGEEDAVVGDALRWEAGLCGGSDAMARSDRGCGCEGVDYKNEKGRRVKPWWWRLTESARSRCVVVAAAKNVITPFTTDAAKPSTIQQTLDVEVNFSLSTHFCEI
jgi:hypothetical protein